jgi:hypothetical protein
MANVCTRMRGSVGHPIIFLLFAIMFGWPWPLTALAQPPSVCEALQNLGPSIARNSFLPSRLPDMATCRSVLDKQGVPLFTHADPPEANRYLISVDLRPTATERRIATWPLFKPAKPTRIYPPRRTVPCAWPRASRGFSSIRATAPQVVKPVCCGDKTMSFTALA